MNEPSAPLTHEEDLDSAFRRLVEVQAAIYTERGFRRRLGYGQRPAIVHIDLANAWTRPGSRFSCDGTDEIVAGVQRLNAAARPKEIPIVYTTTAYDITDAPNSDMGLWSRKAPIADLVNGSELVQIDDRIAPEPNELVIVKKRASAFHGTNLSSFLKASQVDTLIITGLIASGCVRHTTEDAMAEGFRPILVRECIGDRVPGVTAWNLFDLDCKMADVESLDSVVAYLGNVSSQARE
jgi:N-carbamoylsarcosine amidase